MLDNKIKQRRTNRFQMHLGHTQFTFDLSQVLWAHRCGGCHKRVGNSPVLRTHQLLHLSHVYCEFALACTNTLTCMLAPIIWIYMTGSWLLTFFFVILQLLSIICQVNFIYDIDFHLLYTLGLDTVQKTNLIEPTPMRTKRLFVTGIIPFLLSYMSYTMVLAIINACTKPQTVRTYFPEFIF